LLFINLISAAYIKAVITPELGHILQIPVMSFVFVVLLAGVLPRLKLKFMWEFGPKNVMPKHSVFDLTKINSKPKGR
jgi:hypothetical protein